MAKYTVLEITDWEQDDHEMAGDSCHMSMADVYFKLAEEYKEKVDNGNWPGIPFTCDADDEDDAFEKYKQEHCEYDYIVPIDADIEDTYDEKHDEEWMERHPNGWYNNENDYGVDADAEDENGQSADEI